MTLRSAHRYLPLLALSGCNLISFSGGSSSTPSSGAESAAAASEQPYTPSAASLEWFQTCSAHYGRQMNDWAPLLKESRALIAETKSLPYYEAASKLSVQSEKLCVEGAKVNSGGLKWHNDAGVRLEVVLELARRSVERKYKTWLLSSNYRNFIADEVPFTANDEFDRNSFCVAVQKKGLTLSNGERFAPLSGQPSGSAHWLDAAEFERFRTKQDAVLKSYQDALAAVDELASAPGDDGKSYAVQGDYGKVTGVKKDGSALVVSLAHITVPYTCQHSGQYRFNGVEWTDCDYVDAAPVVSYKFSARFEDVPASGIKAGDTVSFVGLVNGKVLFDAKKPDAKWESTTVHRIDRGKKPVFAVNTVDLCRP